MEKMCVDCHWGILAVEGKTDSGDKYRIKKVMLRLCSPVYPPPEKKESAEGEDAECINPEKFYPHGQPKNI